MSGLELLLRCAWKGSVILGAGFAFKALLRNRSAALRHIIWTACLAALLVLPAAVAWMPAWNVVTHQQTLAVAAQAIPAMPLAAAASTMTAMRPPVNPWLWAWAAGAGLALLRTLLGTARITWIVRRARDTAGCDNLARGLGIRRRVRVLLSELAPVPITWGIARPVIVLPSESREWTESRRHTVLLHELIHVRRWDLPAQMVGQAACCLFWFHPLAWIAARQLRDERERACDDAVLACGIPGPEYAGHLMDLVRAVAARRGRWAQAPAMAEASGLESRVRAMLDPSRDRRPVNRRKILAVAAAGAAVVLPLAAMSETTRVVWVAAPAQTLRPVAAVPSKTVDAPPSLPPRRILAAVTAPAPAPAPQKPVGSLSGTVRDPSGAVIPGCTVVLRNPDGSGGDTTLTDSTGQYRFAALPAGRYAVEMQARGFAAYRSDQIEIAGGAAAHVNGNLEVGAITESVQIFAQKPANLPEPAAQPQRVMVGGNVQPAMLLDGPKPRYPVELREAGIEGTVVLRTVISKEGLTTNLVVVNNGVDPRLIQPAIDAVSRWRYRPTLLNGQPIEVPTTVSVDFKLSQ